MKLRVTITKTLDYYGEVSRIVDVPDELHGNQQEIQEWLDENAEDLTFNIHRNDWDDDGNEEVFAIKDWEEADDQDDEDEKNE